MKEIDVKQIQETITTMIGDIEMNYPKDILKSLHNAYENEKGMSKDAMKMLLDNAEIASNENIPICQDTGMAIVYLTIGQDVHFTGGSLQEAIQQGVRDGYEIYYLRKSVVNDPVFDRKNTKDNTPAVIYSNIVDGDQVTIEIMAKGFGSENMSATKMLKPAQGIEGVKEFILDTIRQAGPNACPPMIVGVGIGGTFDYSAYLSKKALMRDFETYNGDERYAQLEKELEEEANALKIGPMGLHGKTTALRIFVETYPTHIAGMPVSVNICCHACRHAKVVL